MANGVMRLASVPVYEWDLTDITAEEVEALKWYVKTADRELFDKLPEGDPRLSIARGFFSTLFQAEEE